MDTTDRENMNRFYLPAKPTRLAFITIFLFYFSWAAMCQGETARIHGEIIDQQTNAPIKAVQLISEQTGIGCMSDLDGRYAMDLPPGNHKIIVERVGYKLIEFQVKLQPDERKQFDLVLVPQIYKNNPVTITDEYPTESIFAGRLSRETLAAVPAFSEVDALRAVQTMPGVLAASDYSSQVYIRGSPADQTLITIDDVTVYNPYHLGGIFSMFNSDGIDHIEFQPGLYSAEYGGRLAGRLNIAPRYGNPESLKGKVSLGTTSSRFQLNGPLGKIRYFVGARRTYFDFIEKLFSGEFGGYYFTDIQSGISMRLDAKNHFSIFGFYSRDALSNILEDDEIHLDGLREPVWGNRIASARWSHQFNPELHFDAHLSYSNAYVTSSTLHIDVDNQIRDLSLKNRLQFSTNSHQLLAGFDISQYQYAYRWHIDNADNLEDIIGDPEAVFFDGAPPQYQSLSSNRSINFYLQDVFQISRKTSLQFGGRLEWQSLSKGLILLPRLQLRHMMLPGFQINGSFAQHAQYNYTLKALKRDDILDPFSISFPVSDTIEPLRDTQYAVGMQLRLPGDGKIRSEVYFKNLYGIPVYDQNRELVTTNAGRAGGLDVQIQFGQDRIFSSVSYSLGYSQIKENQNWVYAGYDRRHSIKFFGGIKPGRGWSIHLFWAFLSGQPYTPLSGYFIGAGSTRSIDSPPRILYEDSRSFRGFRGKIPGVTNSLRHPVYHRLDIGFSKIWQYQHTLMELRFQLLNAYFQKNLVFLEPSEEFGISESEAGRNFPIIPSFEISLHF